ncbi:MAG: polysaccharide deacetylase family protein [Acidobacteria bacterium]|nr:MAG: polysaccharide deacetylase family protein [Acidobacteriota bacterium]
MRNAISVDVEEYFHPSEVEKSLHTDQWTSLPSLVEPHTRRVLEIFDRHGVKGTFFILGWVAQRQPALVREIAARGHEIACHSFSHRLVYNLTPADFREDTQHAVRAIEDACGITPRAYRAPSYSITRRSLWALEILAECGFTHDSSIYPIQHDRYGIPGFGRHAQTLSTPSGLIVEVPIATVRLSERIIAPVGGGAYLRLLPYRYTAAGIRRINHYDQQPACVYFHPWELDPGQPRVASGWVSRVRTYGGLRSMAGKLERLLSDFEFTTLIAVYGAAESNPLQLQTVHT